MKRMLLILLGLSLGFSSFGQITMESLFAKEGEKHDYFLDKGLKRYLVKSGMRVVINEGFGATVDTIFWDDWGFREATYSYNKKKLLKGKKKLKPETIMILDGANMYSLNTEDKVYNRINNPIVKSIASMEGEDFIENEEEMVKKWFGGEDLGKENVDGKTCTKFKALGGYTWVYKGMAYKGEAKLLGMKSSFKVSTLKENMRVAEGRITLPDGYKSVMDMIKEDKK